MKTKISIAVSLFSLMFIFTQCVERTEIQKVEFDPSEIVDPHGGAPVTNNPVEGVDGGSITGEFSETGATEVARSVTSLGIKDFEQIHKTMSVLSGVPTTNNRISSAFNDLSNQLPGENSVKQFGSSTQFAIFKLGSEYCDAMMEDGNIYRNAFSGINLDSSPNNILGNLNQKTAFVNAFINRFWGPGVQGADMEAQTRTELIALVDDLLVNENMGQGSTSRKIAKGVCASIIITPPVIML